MNSTAYLITGKKLSGFASTITKGTPAETDRSRNPWSSPDEPAAAIAYTHFNAPAVRRVKESERESKPTRSRKR